MGEIHIAGAGIARGYLNRPALTAERFIASPFVAGERLYRTGDLGRYFADGNIEFLGRNDFQVKLRGYRIELGEIESRMREYPGVSEAVVLAREDEPGEKRLVGYYTVAEGESVRVEALREHLTRTLASYMVPAAYVQMPALPLTPNGKLDRGALPAPDDQAYAKKEYEAPMGTVETAVAGIWSDVLGVQRIGRADNFFELGGHSLLAMRVLERMRRVGLAVDVRLLFLTPILSELALVAGRQNAVMEVPPNLITAECERITPELLPLVELSQEEIDRVVSGVPGGVRNVQDIYALSPLQEGILFHHLMSQEGDPYVLWTLLSFTDRERLDAYVSALDAVIARHDILRTAVVWESLSKPVQVVWREAALLVNEVTLDRAGADVIEQLKQLFVTGQYRVEIRRAPMIRLLIAQDPASDRWVGMLLSHHLALDHVSVELISTEVQLYLSGQGQQLPSVLPYRCLVAQGREVLKSNEYKEFFRKMLGSVEEPTAPFGLRDVHGDGSGILEARRELGPTLSSRLRRCARSLGVSAASVFHVAWGQVLSRASGQEDPVFGTVMFGRMHGSEGVERVMGPFINTLPVRIRLRAVSVERCVRETHQLLAQLLQHEHAPLAEVQQYSQIPAPTPLFTALLNYRHNVSAAQLLQLSLSSMSQGVEYLASEERTNYPLTLSVDDYGDEYGLTAQVDAGVGAQRVCAMMLVALEHVVTALESHPTQWVSELEVLPESEREQLLVQWNQTEMAYPRQRCIHELFEDQAARDPDAIALIYEGEQLSYGELNRKANQLAHYLRSCGVGPDQRVALCMERSLELVVGLLGILKAGAAYVPLDPAYPAERLAYMLSDSAPRVALSHGAARAALESALQGLTPRPPVVALDRDAPVWSQTADENLDPATLGLSSQHLAYIIYTSGSTGKPKGVMIEHRSVVNRMSDVIRRFRLGPSDRLIALTALNHDLSVFDIFGGLGSGATLVMPLPDRRREPRRRGRP